MASFNQFMVVTSTGIPLYVFIEALLSDLQAKGVKGKVQTEVILEGGHKVVFTLSPKSHPSKHTEEKI